MDKYDYDKDVDAFTLRKHEFDYAYSIDITSEIILDLDDKQNLIGIEMLDASKVVQVDPSLLIHPRKIIADVVSTEEGLTLTIKFDFDDSSQEIDVPISNLVSSDNSLVVSV